MGALLCDRAEADVMHAWCAPLVAGASAVQIGTANYYDPQVSEKLVDALPEALQTAGVQRVADLVGTLDTAPKTNQPVCEA